MNPPPNQPNIPRALSILGELQEALGQPQPTRSTSQVNSPPQIGAPNLLTQLRLMTQATVPSPARVSAEVSRAFQPYNLSEARAGSSRRSLGARIFRRRIWSHVVFALGGPQDTKTPTRDRKLFLESQGLGSKVLRVDFSASATELEEEIRNLFPQFADFKIEILKSTGGGESRPLSRVSLTEEFTKVEDLNLLIGRSIVYIRPEIAIVQNEPDTSSRETNANCIHEPSVSSDQADRSNVALHEHESSKLEGSDGEVLSMVDFRESVYHDNPGIQPIFVQRDDFAMQVLGVYKSSNFNLLKKPQIIFAGEAGADVGALQKEYFWRGITSFLNGKFNGRFPFFEGELGHKLPSTDAALIRSGAMTALGKFMAHGAIHTGLAFFGVSNAVVEYITGEYISDETPLTMNAADVADLDLRSAIQRIDEWTSSNDPNPEELSLINVQAEKCSLTVRASFDNRFFIRDHMLYYDVIEKRKSQLDSIKLAFQEVQMMDFLRNKDFLIQGLFPREEDLDIPPSFIVSKITCDGDHPHIDYVKEFILQQSKKGVREMLAAWTGWSIIPDESLTVKIVEDGEFCIHSCFQEMEIPQQFSREQVFDHLKLVLENGTSGFGTT